MAADNSAGNRMQKNLPRRHGEGPSKAKNNTFKPNPNTLMAVISVLEIVYPLRRHSERCPRSGDPEEPCVSSSSPKATLFVKDNKLQLRQGRNFLTPNHVQCKSDKAKNLS